MTEKFKASNTLEIPEEVEEGGVIDSPWQDEAEATSEDLKREEEAGLEFAVHPNENKVNMEITESEATKKAKVMIARFQEQKFGKNIFNTI